MCLIYAALSLLVRRSEAHIRHVSLLADQSKITRRPAA